MNTKERYDLWVSSELGLLKGVVLKKDSFTNHGDVKTLDKTQSITSMCMQKIDKKTTILMGLKNGCVKTFDTSTYQMGSSLTCNKQSPVRGVAALADGSIVTCLENGNLQRWKNEQCDMEKSVGDDIKVMVHNKHTNDLIATGGQENDLKLWQLKSMDKPVFVAKNVKNDFLNLRIPIWITAIDFFREDNNKVAVGSANHIVRVYDRREKRRPVFETDWHEHPITAIAMKPNNNSVLVGNSTGHMSDIDLRSGKQLGAYKGNCGSIRSIACHKTQPYVAVCGLDRVLKIYDQTRKVIKQIYMKSNLNSILMPDAELQLTESASGEKRERVGDDGEEGDNIWQAMETVNDQTKHEKPKKKKKK